MTMRPELQEFAEECERVLKKHDAAKDDSWQSCNLLYLYNKLMEEIEEFKKNPTDHNLPDITNICMMLWHRLRE